MSNEFQYKVTLNSGAYAFAQNGILLDRLIRDRWQLVKSIEVIPNTMPRIDAVDEDTPQEENR